VGIQAQALAAVFAQFFEGQSSPTPGGWRREDSGYRVLLLI